MSIRETHWAWAACLVAGVGSISTARADSPVYADIGGTCGGLTPCYSTIQEAVYNVSDPDGSGPLFAEVSVFPGTYDENVNLSAVGRGAMGDVQMTTVDFAGAPAPGTATIDPGVGSAIMHESNLYTGRVTLEGFVVTSDTSSAIQIFADGDITVRNVVAHDAGMNSLQDPNNLVGTGIAVTSMEDVAVLNSTAQNCRVSGVFAVGVGNVIIDSVDAHDNLRHGIFAEAGKLIVRNSNAFDNNVIGMRLRGANEALVDQCHVERNLEDGVQLSAGTAMSVMSSTARENGGYGFYLTSVMGSVTLDRLTADGSGFHGIRVVEAREIAVTNSTSTRSGLDGFALDALENITLDSLFSRRNYRAYALFTYGDVRATNAAAESSVSHGFEIHVGGAVTMNRITSIDTMDGAGVFIEPRTPTGFVRGVTIRNSLLTGSGFLPGIYLRQLAPPGLHVITGNIICDNDDGMTGIIQEFDSTAVIDARGNWWGDVTGPKRPNSNAGLGDGIVPGGGQIRVDPWIDQITAVVSHHKATLANDVTVNFQFRHSGSETFLGEGPGAVGARRPFTVTTSNGTVKSHDGTANAVSSFVEGAKGIVEVIAKADAVGPVTIELSGLCFPARSVKFDVVPVPIPLPPNPMPVIGADPDPTPIGGAEPDPSAVPNSTKSNGAFCGAGVPMTAGFSVIGLLAVGRVTARRHARRVR